jgi:hypothetical protein
VFLSAPYIKHDITSAFALLECPLSYTDSCDLTRFRRADALCGQLII